MAFARTESFDQRAAILDRLTGRNRLVGVLRWAVPAIGLLAFLALAAQIFVANVVRQYGVSGLRIDRGNLVVETPQYTGMGKDGSRYVVNAREAQAPLADSQNIAMTDATLDFSRPGRAAFHATSAAASMDTGTQVVVVPGIVSVYSDDGMHGTLVDVRSDMKAGVTVARGPVDMTFSDGSTLEAADMHYDGDKALWRFTRATLVVPDLQPARYPIPYAPYPWVVR
jgi:hypothetical protein